MTTTIELNSLFIKKWAQQPGGQLQSQYKYCWDTLGVHPSVGVTRFLPAPVQLYANGMSAGGLRVCKDGVTAGHTDWKLCYTLNYLSLTAEHIPYFVRMLGCAKREPVGSPRFLVLVSGSLLTFWESIYSHCLLTSGHFLVGRVVIRLNATSCHDDSFVHQSEATEHVSTYCWCLDLVHIPIRLIFWCSIFYNFRVCDDIFVLPCNFIWYTWEGLHSSF